MKTDPPHKPTPPAHGAGSGSGNTPRPRGRVFDVMRPGKAPASPTSRPVVIGHQAKAQRTQVRVSGIGARDPDAENLQSHKISLAPLHRADAPADASTAHVSTATPAPDPAPAPVSDSAPDPTATPAIPEPMDADLAAVAKDLGADVTAQPMQVQSVQQGETQAVSPENVPETGMAPNEASAAAPSVNAEQPASAPADVPVAAAADAPQNGPASTGDAAAPDPLNDVALEPDAPAPDAAVPEHPKLPIPEVTDDDPVHTAAEPSLQGQVVVSPHSAASVGNGKIILLVVLLVVFVFVVFDILLDVGVLSLSGVPHTHLF